jgi:hypothetical protein
MALSRWESWGMRKTTGRALVEHRDRPVLHLARRVGLTRDVGDLLELERALQRHGVAEAPAEEQHVAGAADGLHRLVDRPRILRGTAPTFSGTAVELRRHRLPPRSERSRVRASISVNTSSAVTWLVNALVDATATSGPSTCTPRAAGARDGGPDDVHHAHHLPALELDLVDGAQRVERLARLEMAKNSASRWMIGWRCRNSLAISAARRHPRQRLDRHRADHARVVARAAADAPRAGCADQVARATGSARRAAPARPPPASGRAGSAGCCGAARGSPSA